jgi:hypothetical protein
MIKQNLKEQFRTQIDSRSIDWLTQEQIKDVNEPYYQKAAANVIKLLKKLGAAPMGGYYSETIEYKGDRGSVYAGNHSTIIDKQSYDNLISTINSPQTPAIVSVNAEEQLRYVARKNLNLVFWGSPGRRNLVDLGDDLGEILLGLEEIEVDIMARDAETESSAVSGDKQKTDIVKENKTKMNKIIKVSILETKKIKKMIEQQLDLEPQAGTSAVDLMSIIAQEVKENDGMGLFVATTLSPDLVQYDIPGGSDKAIGEIRAMLIGVDAQTLEEALSDHCDPSGHGRLGMSLCMEIKGALAEHRARESDMENPP